MLGGDIGALLAALVGVEGGEVFADIKVRVGDFFAAVVEGEDFIAAVVKGEDFIAAVVEGEDFITAVVEGRTS